MYHPFRGSVDDSSCFNGSSKQIGHLVRCFIPLTCLLKDRFMQLYKSEGMKPSGPSSRPAHVFQISEPAVVDAADRRAWYSCLAAAVLSHLFLSSSLIGLSEDARR